MPAQAEYWWRDIPKDAHWHGVFQGGGAKGVAYVGALQAMKEKSQWFCSVAGSSAGALTASLIAAGYDPDEMAGMTGELLEAVRPDTVLDRCLYALPRTRFLTRYSAQNLECGLERHLRDAVARRGGEGDRDVTFEALHAATGISLYVVALDATLGQPVPFCVERTSQLAVSAAVASSCAIPLVFAPRYVEIDMGPSGFESDWPPFRRLVDGGAWANFPIFIYHDAAFRDFYDLPPLAVDAKVMGFSFDDAVTSFAVRVPRRFTEDPHRHLNSFGAKLVLYTPKRGSESDSDEEESDSDEEAGFLDNVRWRMSLVPGAFAYALGVCVLGLIYVLLVTTGVDGARHGKWWLVALVTAGAFLFTVGLLTIWRVVKALTHEGRDTLRSVLGLATRPAAWAGVVRNVAMIWVSPSSIDTTDFRMLPETASRAIQDSKDSCLRQISGALEGATPYVANRALMLEALAQRPPLPADWEEWTAQQIPTHSSGLTS